MLDTQLGKGSYGMISYINPIDLVNLFVDLGTVKAGRKLCWIRCHRSSRCRSLVAPITSCSLFCVAIIDR